MAIREPRVFTIPPGVPFLPTLAQALLDGRLIDGFPPPGDPLALADATIFVPTQRAAAALSQELLATCGKPSLLIPRIAPLGAFEPDQRATFFAPDDGATRPGLPPAVGDIARLHTLARLIRGWGKALKGAIRTMDAGGLVFDRAEAALVATTPAQCYALAGDLAALIDDMIIEGVDWRKLDDLAPEGYDSYWRITLDFLKIAFSSWPQWLEQAGLVDRAKRLALVVQSETARLSASGALSGPTIIAGSTGANRATAELMATIARSEGGAVVLPGLDISLDERAWSMVGVTDDAGYGAASHPQALLRRLIELIGVKREEVTPLGAQPPALAARAAFLSEALRPPDATDAWALREAALSTPAVDAALDRVALIVADNETEEALALAIAMREVLETPGKTAALVTPDSSIARRVSAELSRWGVAVEDSAGRSLGQTEAGTLARLILSAAVRFAPLPAQALLAHPAVRLSRPRGELELSARALELGVFRAAPLPTLDDLDEAFAAAKLAAEDRRAHPAVRFLREEERAAANSLLRDLVAALAPLRELKGSTLRQCLEAHRASLDTILTSPEEEGSQPHGLETVDELMESWRDAASDGFGCSVDQYASLFDEALGLVRAPPIQAGHPRLQILGLLEARLLAFDRVLIAGLDEKVWPPAVGTDAFLNRPMRAKLGLSPPERRIGQTAHDFSSALGASEAVLSRARKRAGEPTVASRFLQRIVAAAGAASDAVAAAERRGETYLGYARLLDEPDKVEPIRPPKPKPPVELRPLSLSVTRIETLRRDPYSIYAQRILRLQKLGPIERELDGRAAGDAWHSALQDFAERYPSGPLPPGSRARLTELVRQRFALMLEDPAFAGLAWPTIEKAIDFVIDFERRARGGIVRIFVERQGAIEIPLFDGSAFRLTARADRIDLLRGGGGRLIDYKSGSPPCQKQVKNGLAPQLTLEAAILIRGGFEGLEAIGPKEAIYLKLGGANGGRQTHAAGEDADVAKLANEHLVELKALLDQFASAETPYLSRPLPEFASRFAEYDHLARVKEWSSTAGATDAEGGVGP